MQAGHQGQAGAPVSGAALALLQAGSAPQSTPTMPAISAQAATQGAVPQTHAPALAQAPAAMPRADANVHAPQVAAGARADASAAPAALAPAAARPDAAPMQRAQDPGLAATQRTQAAAATMASPTAAAQGTTATGAAGNTAALATAATTAPATAVAGSTAATAPPVAQAADARNPGNPLAVNDRGLPARADAAGHTGENVQRRGLERRIRSLPGGLSTLLLALGAQGHTGNAAHDRAAAERELREAAMQWVFWLLAIIAYGCIGFAVIALLPSGSLGPLEGLAPERGRTAGLAMTGLVTALGAWWFARRMARGTGGEGGAP